MFSHKQLFILKNYATFTNNICRNISTNVTFHFYTFDFQSTGFNLYFCSVLKIKNMRYQNFLWHGLKKLRLEL